MSVNRHRENLLVLPEDDAMRQIANGFLLHPGIRSERIQVMAPASGWLAVIDAIENKYTSVIDRFRATYIVALIDFDGRADRASNAKAKIRPAYLDRVFILGVKTEAEDLKRSFGASFEAVGGRLAEGCLNPSAEWNHELLADNADELQRMRGHVSGFLFGAHD